MHSEPVLLGVVRASPAGVVDAQLVIPAFIAPGAHTVVLGGTDDDGSPALVRHGVTVEASGTGPLATIAGRLRTGVAISFTG